MSQEWLKIKELGNAEFKAKRYPNAINYYTQAISKLFYINFYFYRP